MKKILLLATFLLSVCWVFAGNPGAHDDMTKSPKSPKGHIEQPCMACAVCEWRMICVLAANCDLAAAQLEELMRGEGCGKLYDK